MAPIPFLTLQQHMVQKLRKGLPPQLTYHCLDHTLDVLKQAEIIALAEGISCADDMLTLKVAALYHDAGFITTYQNHEAYGCELARQELPGFGFGPEQIETICGLIMATKIPQSPRSHLEQAICDADLDYLGRKDFTRIARQLFLELHTLRMVADEEEWDVRQVLFLEKHQYFTAYSRQKREKNKQAHLAALRTKVGLAQ
ncbi:HD domain-containing protein [Pontibacter chitinilyticus]|uniref:HD domain-containing protein n=1 Tax=Pontibacter chitinilyticus TaxID=2674989 RepID=UPI00321B640B